MSKEYVAKESTSQEILTKVNPAINRVKVCIGDFVTDDAEIIKGRLDRLEHSIYGQ